MERRRKAAIACAKMIKAKIAKKSHKNKFTLSPVKVEEEAEVPCMYFPLVDIRAKGMNVGNPRPVICPTRDQAFCTAYCTLALVLLSHVSGVHLEPSKTLFSDPTQAIAYCSRAVDAFKTFGCVQEGDYVSLKICTVQGTFVEIETLKCEVDLA